MPGVPEVLSPGAAALYSSIGSLIASGVGADRAYGILADIASLPYIEQGFSPVEARLQAQRAGEVITRSQVRQIAGEVRTSLELRQQLARLNPDNPVPAHLIDYNTQLRHTDDFVHTVSMILRDPVTGFTVQRFANYVAPYLVSPNEAIGAFTNQEIENPRYPGESGDFEVIGASLHNVAHRI